MIDRKAPFQRKSLGQVFLNQDWPCQKIAKLIKDSKAKDVLEIGPGAGVLTKALLAESMHVLAVEKDTRFSDLLKTWPPQEAQHLDIVNQDILSFETKDFFNRTEQTKAICGNIPYNISTPILLKLLPLLSDVKIIVLMVQEEFATRVASVHDKKDYGSLSIFAQLRAEVKLEFLVPRSCFSPVPKVDSAVISLMPKKGSYPEETLNLVEKICRQAFNQRRKKLSNSISAFLNEANLTGFPIDLNRRAETLSPREFVQIADYLQQQKTSP